MLNLYDAPELVLTLSDHNRLSAFNSPKIKKTYISPYARDLTRLIHSPYFRKLSDKTLLYPTSESDYFRNRLTHSLEVADIGKSITMRLNHDNIHDWHSITGDKIDYDLVQFACLAHDIGHPPFGHIGERTLNDLMQDYGGFECNAQTLRIISKLEKKQTLNDNPVDYINQGIVDEQDHRIGLNPTFRSLASVIKYCQPISLAHKKGYYHTEVPLVEAIKKNVISKYGDDADVEYFRTIECSIMDLADDIAYTTFDMDDALKSGFLNPLDFITYQYNPSLKAAFVDEVKSAISKHPALAQQLNILKKSYGTDSDELVIINQMIEIVNKIFVEDSGAYQSFIESVEKPAATEGILNYHLIVGGYYYNLFKSISVNDYFRNLVATKLVNSFLDNVIVTPNKTMPALSLVTLDQDLFFKLECIKRFVFVTQVRSNRVQFYEFRGNYIITKIWNELVVKKRHELMPADFRMAYFNFSGDEMAQRRVLCDFIASMTDTYAVEFYGRLFGENPQTMFKTA